MKKRAIYLTLGCLMSLIFLFTSCDKKKKEPIPAPSGLKYVPALLDALEGYPKQSAVPVISSSEGVSWKITSVPDHGGNITIDEKGIIGTKAELPIGNYVITVYASNSGGETEFPSAFTVKVSAPIAPTKLEYPPVGAGAANTLSVTRGQITFASPVPVTKGAALTFSILTTEPAEVKNYLSINPSTGVITIADPKLPAGTHKITVEIANQLGKVTTVLTLEVKPSIPPANLKYTPNVSDPTKTPEGGTVSSPEPTWDKVEGYKYEFDIRSKKNPNITIDPATGVLTILPDLAKGDYVIDVGISNGVDIAIFTSVYTFKIGDPIKPTFVTYTPSTLIYQKNAGYTFGDHEVKSDGTKLTYTFTATSKSGMNNLSNWANINPKDGKFVISDFIGIPVDEYTIEVTATNSQGFSAKGTVLAIVKPEVAITNLQYPNAPAEVNFGTAFDSGLPTVMGSGMRKDIDAYTVTKITRDGNMYTNNYDIWMDDNTMETTPRGQYGQIKTVNDLPPGEYKLTIDVKNAINAFSFPDVVVFKVKGGANPPMTLTYPAISTPTATTPILMMKTKPGAMFSSGMPMITGGTPTKYYYRRPGYPADQSAINGITINSTTGVITVDGTSIGDKNYEIEVRAANNDGLALANVIVAYDKTYFYNNPYTNLEVGGVYEMLIRTCSQNPMLCHGNASARKMGGTEVPNYLRYFSTMDNVIDYAKGMTKGTLATPATNSFLDRMMISPTDPMRSTKRMPINVASTNPDDIALLKKWVTDGMSQGTQPTAWPASDP